MELEAEAALGDASLPLLDALGAAPSAPEASLVPSVPTPQTGISIPMMATPRFVRQVPEDGMENLWRIWRDTWNYSKKNMKKRRGFWEKNGGTFRKTTGGFMVF